MCRAKNLVCDYSSNHWLYKIVSGGFSSHQGQDQEAERARGLGSSFIGIDQLRQKAGPWPLFKQFWAPAAPALARSEGMVCWLKGSG